MTHTETPGNRILRTVRPTVIAYDLHDVARSVRWTINGKPAKAAVTEHGSIRLTVEQPLPTRIPR